MKNKVLLKKLGQYRFLTTDTEKRYLKVEMDEAFTDVFSGMPPEYDEVAMEVDTGLIVPMVGDQRVMPFGPQTGIEWMRDGLEKANSLRRAEDVPVGWPFHLTEDTPYPGDTEDDKSRLRRIEPHENFFVHESCIPCIDEKTHQLCQIRKDRMVRLTPTS